MKLVLGRDDLASAAGRAAREAGTPLERLAVKPVHKASRGFVDDGDADVCEIAIVTLLQAAAYGKDVVLLPVTTLGRYQHQTLVTMSGRPVGEVAGHSVGVRSWSQTTGVWVRGFLTEQYGMDLRAIDWVTYEDGHVAEYTDPAWVRRAPAGAKLQADFLDGRLDFGIMGNELPEDDRIQTAIADPYATAEKWAVRAGFAPVNHVMAVRTAAARAHAPAICAMYDAMRATLAAAPGDGPVDLSPVGFAALRGPVAKAAEYARDQEILPRAVTYDELVERACAALGVPAARLGG